LQITESNKKFPKEILLHIITVYDTSLSFTPINKNGKNTMWLFVNTKEFLMAEFKKKTS